jgi:tetrahydromethanopterin:alpha-L-glutamate ligase
LAKPKIGVIGLPGKWSTERLADAVEERTGFRLVVDMGQVELDLANGELHYQDHDLCKLDGLLVKKITAVYCPNTLDRLELLRVAEQAGVRVFSKPAHIIRLIDRLSCTVTLRSAGIPMPETRVTEDIDAAFEAVRDFGSAIFKPLYSTKARGMVVIDEHLGEDKILSKIKAFNADNPMMYIQKKMDLQGSDLGMVFLGGEYLGCYARVSKTGSWNTTIHHGGRYQAFTPSQDLIDLAYEAQKPFDMDFTTVDVADTSEGPVVFEVSAFGGFRGARDGIGINAAEHYVDYALNKLKE